MQEATNAFEKEAQKLDEEIMLRHGQQQKVHQNNVFV
jgi:hypothetical protein